MNLLWLLFVVVLPFPTEIAGAYDSDRFTAGLYIATILALGLCQTTLIRMIHHHPTLENPDNPVDPRELAASLIQTTLTAVALLLTLLIPGLTFKTLLLLLLTPLVLRAGTHLLTKSDPA